MAYAISFWVGAVAGGIGAAAAMLYLGILTLS